MNRAVTVSRALRSGTVWVNTFLDGTPAIPFGGGRESGFGRETGREGLLEFTTLKTVQVRTRRRGYPFPAEPEPASDQTAAPPLLPRRAARTPW